jgi:adenine-specific DNA-methyltransferase
MNEIFGDENFLGMFVWQSKKGKGANNVVTDHEYVLCYSREAVQDSTSKILIEGEELNQVDDKGSYRLGRELNKWGASSRREDRPKMYFPIPGPNGIVGTLNLYHAKMVHI